MEILKIIGVALITTIAAIIVKQIKPEFSIIISLGGGIVVLLMLSSGLNNIVEYFSEIVTRTNINSGLFSIVLKIVGVGYLTEFSSNLCVDSGMSSLADKINLAGKVVILVLSLPVITSLLDTITEILK